eukprot:CAMPEP_0182576206 /NCGR_PEP_ID=MMETSP1324-20130603/32963_1 /TAXON_ID=236786 /ORGANISM="Florenciella sp., Strain RCC1587" /LENGTH=100 /DNA_ID=CAMNT_0024791873 /DNA_START=781 /DNA_END=1080 /DNA_ORIENTATION=-
MSAHHSSGSVNARVRTPRLRWHTVSEGALTSGGLAFLPMALTVPTTNRLFARRSCRAALLLACCASRSAFFAFRASSLKVCLASRSSRASSRFLLREPTL